MLDINDNSPEFTEEQYEVPIEENTDTIDFSVTATDGDVGTNAEIVYEFINGNTNNAFVIGEHRVIQYSYIVQWERKKATFRKKIRSCGKYSDYYVATLYLASHYM